MDNFLFQNLVTLMTRYKLVEGDTELPIAQTRPEIPKLKKYFITSKITQMGGLLTSKLNMRKIFTFE